MYPQQFIVIFAVKRQNTAFYKKHIDNIPHGHFHIP